MSYFFKENKNPTLAVPCRRIDLWGLRPAIADQVLIYLSQCTSVFTSHLLFTVHLFLRLVY